MYVKEYTNKIMKYKIITQYIKFEMLYLIWIKI